jgi:hypothetical protein
MKLHFYFIFKRGNSYIHQTIRLRHKTLDHVIDDINTYYQLTGYATDYKKFMYHNIKGFAFIIHRILLLCVIFYDMRYNNMILSHMYNILPFIFVYELWVKYSIFLMPWNLLSNDILVQLLYHRVVIHDYDKEYIYIYDGISEQLHEPSTIKTILTEYVFRDFVIDPFMPVENPIKSGFQQLIYYYWDYLIFERIFNKHLIDLVLLLLLLLLIFNL